MRKLQKKTGADPKLPEYLFEVSWEVGNKVGGIYTVITSKAARVIERYGDGYFLIGPYLSEQQRVQELEDVAPPEWLGIVFEALEREGIACSYGKWKVKGSPSIILIDSNRSWGKLNEIKISLWEWYRVDSIRGGNDFNEPLLWAWLVGRFIEECTRALRGKKIVAQFHEWLSGAGLLYAHHKQLNVGTVFTTHATVAGRAFASNGIDIYRHAEEIDVDQMTRRFSVESKHTLEKATAEVSNVFTTVSAMTGEEAELFIGRKPDFLLPNGLDISTYPKLREQFTLHEEDKERLRDFAAYFFFPYYRFDLEETLFYYTASRYEFRDKGLDVFIAALGNLNKSLKEQKSKKTVVVFIWVPTGVAGPRPELVRRREAYYTFLHELESQKLHWGAREVGMFLDRADQKILSNLSFTGAKSLRDLTEVEGNALRNTHMLLNPNDQIMSALDIHGLKNSSEDRVKVVFYPIYLIQGDAFLNLGYHKSLQAGHLGVYPSYYEPWGYTPLESAALGVSSVTTDLTGFGRYLLSTKKVNATTRFPGVFIVRRVDKSETEVVEGLSKILLRFTLWTRTERHRNGGAARKLSELADWKFFVEHYLRAHRAALLRSSRS